MSIVEMMDNYKVVRLCASNMLKTPSNSLLTVLRQWSGVVSVACFGVRVSVMFHLMFVLILLVRFGLLSGYLLGKSCPLGWPYVLIVFCLFVIFIYFPFWF